MFGDGSWSHSCDILQGCDDRQSLAGQCVRLVRSSLHGLRHLRHVSEPLPRSEGQRTLSSDPEGLPHEGLDDCPPSPGAGAHLHAHHSVFQEGAGGFLHRLPFNHRVQHSFRLLRTDSHPAGPRRHPPAQDQRRRGPPELLHVSDPGLPLHVLDVRPAVRGSPPQGALPPAAALQPGYPGDPGSSGELVHHAAEEGSQTLPEAEERDGRQRRAEDTLTLSYDELVHNETKETTSASERICSNVWEQSVTLRIKFDLLDKNACFRFKLNYSEKLVKCSNSQTFFNQNSIYFSLRNLNQISSIFL